MSKDAFTKGMGCIGSLMSLAVSILLSYLSLHFGWGLEVKSWTAYIWFGIVGASFTFMLAHLFGKLIAD